MSIQTLTHSCDVLVVGGGPAALFAAIKASQKGARVILASKGMAGSSGPSCTPNHGGIGAFFPGIFQSNELLKIATEHATYMNDQELNKIIIDRNWEIVQEWIGFGANFIQEQGRYVWTSVGKSYPHLHGVGREYMRVLRIQCEKVGVKIIDRLMITDILTSDGMHPTRGIVSGAVGLYIRNGAFCEIRSKSVVLATGGWCIPSPLSNQTSDITGDGKAIGIRVGCIYRGAGTLSFALGTPGSGTASSLGFKLAFNAKFVNDEGEDIGVQVRKAHRMKIWIDQSHVAYKEQLRGRRIFLDYTHLKPEEVDLMQRTIKPQISSWNQHGFLLPGYIPMTVVLGGDGGAGLKVNNRWETNIEGLYAAGETQGSFYGPGSGVAGAAVQGAIAGENAAEYSLKTELGEVKSFQVRALKDLIFLTSQAPTDDSVDPASVRTRLHEITMKYLVLSTERTLNEALRETIRIKQEISSSRMTSTNPHKIKCMMEVRNIILVLEIIIRAMLMRQESRASIYRDDFPERDDRHWLKWVMAQSKTGNDIEMWMEDVPLPYYKPLDQFGDSINDEAERLAN